jgi:hypothetical protein
LVNRNGLHLAIAEQLLKPYARAAVAFICVLHPSHLRQAEDRATYAVAFKLDLHLVAGIERF